MMMMTMIRMMLNIHVNINAPKLNMNLTVILISSLCHKTMTVIWDFAINFYLDETSDTNH
jgi:hypothetical protein